MDNVIFYCSFFSNGSSVLCRLWIGGCVPWEQRAKISSKVLLTLGRIAPCFPSKAEGIESEHSLNLDFNFCSCAFQWFLAMNILTSFVENDLYPCLHICQRSRWIEVSSRLFSWSLIPSVPHMMNTNILWLP